MHFPHLEFPGNEKDAPLQGSGGRLPVTRLLLQAQPETQLMGFSLSPLQTSWRLRVPAGEGDSVSSRGNHCTGFQAALAPPPTT